MTELESLFDEDIGKARKMDLGAFNEALKNSTAAVDPSHDPAPDPKISK